MNSAWERTEMNTKSFSERTEEGKPYLESVDVEGRIILK
jgi:hypothetical protein